jgi:hypothetical protein
MSANITSSLIILLQLIFLVVSSTLLSFLSLDHFLLDLYLKSKDFTFMVETPLTERMILYPLE